MTLPVRLGGLGIHRTEEIALSAHQVSIHSVQQVVSTTFPDGDLDATMGGSLSKRFSMYDIKPLTPRIFCQLLAWDFPMIRSIYDGMMHVVSLTDKARLLGCKKSLYNLAETPSV